MGVLKSIFGPIVESRWTWRIGIDLIVVLIAWYYIEAGHEITHVLWSAFVVTWLEARWALHCVRDLKQEVEDTKKALAGALRDHAKFSDEMKRYLHELHDDLAKLFQTLKELGRTREQ